MTDAPEPTDGPTRRSITESPWYWVYLFATGALVALLLMGPKFRSRQAQIERKYQGRQRAVRQASGQSPNTPLSDAGETLIDLRPLYAIALLVLGVGGAGILIHRRRVANTARGPAP